MVVKQEPMDVIDISESDADHLGDSLPLPPLPHEVEKRGGDYNDQEDLDYE